MKAFVYCVGSRFMRNNIYKIGKHSGTEKELISRYNTSLINTDVHIFMPVDNYSEKEKEIHTKLKRYQIRRNTGSNSEWFSCKLSIIRKAFGLTFPRSSIQ